MTRFLAELASEERAHSLVPPLRFAVVGGGYYRSAIPTMKNFRFLLRLKLTRIFVFGTAALPDDLVVFCQARNIGLEQIEIEDGIPATSALVFFRAIQLTLDSEREAGQEGRALFCCKDGGAHTSLYFAFLRYLQGWSEASALREAARMGEGQSVKPLSALISTFEKEREKERKGEGGKDAATSKDVRLSEGDGEGKGEGQGESEKREREVEEDENELDTAPSLLPSSSHLFPLSSIPVMPPLDFHPPFARAHEGRKRRASIGHAEGVMARAEAVQLDGYLQRTWLNDVGVLVSILPVCSRPLPPGGLKIGGEEEGGVERWAKRMVRASTSSDINSLSVEGMTDLTKRTVAMVQLCVRKEWREAGQR
mmetsp:Transcript_45669/g.118007  ORF Transcript_45669/g.118007 Transcript_45669/m.118007 type:complete len:367 (-) Transcript_45669:323-1423(-)